MKSYADRLVLYEIEKQRIRATAKDWKDYEQKIQAVVKKLKI